MTNTNQNLEIVRTLGIGGMATVYLARRDEGGESRVVAVKKPHAFLAEDAATLAVFEDEAELGACIRHPNVVSVLDFVRGDEPALVMEWVDGVELGKLVRAAADSGRRLPVDVVAAIARDMLAGLHAAHESRRADGLALDVVHRDVSPQNVLVGFDGAARITDFGVAKAACRDHHTEEGSIKGKLRYLAPEQLGGGCDRRADVFSVGAVMWELLTGERMRAGTGVEMLVEILCAQVQAPSTHVGEAACLDAIVMRALERGADDRFATAAAMLEALEQSVVVASPARVADVIRELMAVETVEAVKAVELEASDAIETFDAAPTAFDADLTVQDLAFAMSSGEYETVRPERPAPFAMSSGEYEILRPPPRDRDRDRRVSEITQLRPPTNVHPFRDRRPRRLRSA